MPTQCCCLRVNLNCQLTHTIHMQQHKRKQIFMLFYFSELIRKCRKSLLKLINKISSLRCKKLNRKIGLNWNLLQKKRKISTKKFSIRKDINSTSFHFQILFTFLRQMRFLSRFVLSNYSGFSQIVRRSPISLESKRCLSFYPIDENLFGLNDEQRQVISFEF